jgi:hypothetical protein
VYRKRGKVAASNRYEYSCSQCGGRVVKPGVSMDEEGKERLHGLHGWKCDTHGAVSVKRSMKSKS